MAEDYYQILGVQRGASTDEIKKAFRTKAHQHHPDKSTGDADAFKKVNEAYQVLSDPKKRQEYDQYGQTMDDMRRNGGGPAGGGFGGFGGEAGNINMDFGDLGDVFQDFFGFGGGGRRARAERGGDIQARLGIDFRMAVFGGEEVVQLRRAVVCDQCHGKGAEPGTDVTTCSTCQGSGRVRQTQQTILGPIATAVRCSTCQGEGQIFKERCRQCHGEGRLEKTEELRVKIPAGIDDGQSIKLAGKGEAGRRGQPNGDLYLTVAIRPDATLKRQGEAIHSAASIPVTTAVLGGTVEVETIDGPVTLKIPAGTVDGQSFSIKNKGVTKLRGHGRGDHLVTVNITIPKKLSSKAKKLLHDLQAEGL